MSSQSLVLLEEAHAKRHRAAQARRLAQGLTDAEASQRLRDYGLELDLEADTLLARITSLAADAAEALAPNPLSDSRDLKLKYDAS